MISPNAQLKDKSISPSMGISNIESTFELLMNEFQGILTTCYGKSPTHKYTKLNIE